MDAYAAGSTVPLRHWMLGLTLATAAATFSTNALAAVQCERELSAQVVALDMPLMWNRLGAQNINGMMYALRRDVINLDTGMPLTAGGDAVPGRVAFRPDRRPRPLALRVRVGDCLTVSFQNLLAPSANPFNGTEVRSGIDFNLDINDQVADRHASFHVTGMQLVNSISDDGSFVGTNPDSVPDSGGSATYKLYAEEEGIFAISSYGPTFGGEGMAGNNSNGLFGAMLVQPKHAAIYRSQLTREEMDLATLGYTADGHPILDYEAVYPAVEPWISEGKADLPVINMIDTLSGEIVHSEINAVIAYGPNGTLTTPTTGPHAGKLGHFPPDTYPLESVGKRNPSVPNRLEPFRDYASIWHDEVASAQMLPEWFEDPVFSHTLHGVRDSFMINYGSGGIGSEIIANRLGVGPMHDCINCQYEEFFLASSTVGDPGLLVDIPANTGLESCAPSGAGCGATGPKANFALYPDDPANVNHSYTGDFVKIRNVHAGQGEQHLFHLHNHQWLFNPNDDNSNYIDAQGLGPGAGYTYEITFGGSGNRNKTSGDAIYHCHFYPHFAQGMWYLWRNHEVFEQGTALQASIDGGGVHTSFVVDGLGIGDATPAAGARALPDGEIVAGTPIPGVVPLPGKPMPPMPAPVTVIANSESICTDGLTQQPRLGDGSCPVGTSERPIGSLSAVTRDGRNPGYPFWIAGMEHTIGQRPTTPPLDMLTAAQADALQNPVDPGDIDPLWSHPGLIAGADGWDGGLPRFALSGVAAGSTANTVTNRLDFSKTIEKSKPVFFPETGTDLERLQMEFMAQRCHDSFLPDGSPAICAGADYTGDGLPDEGGYIVNGALPVAGAPFNEPCIDDRGTLLATGTNGSFFSGETITAMNVTGRSSFSADSPRIYKAANIQIDATFNKQGYHFPQQRILTLWQDVMPTIDKRRPPEPFVIRLNTFDCANYHHTNLVPQFYELDDYQVRTPTDIIGQHIHLPKWDLTAADGSANGWNYEDGTLAPSYVVELIHAINRHNTEEPDPVITDVMGNPVVSSDGRQLSAMDPTLMASAHPYFGSTPLASRWVGARTTTQRWFADPVVNVDGFDRGLGIIFTHDHFGPSTHQQVGLYATVLTEPAGSVWKHNESGTQLGDAVAYGDSGRIDGGPTSWQAAIVTQDNGLSNVGAGGIDDFREFYLEYSDFQHAYEKGVYVGVGPDGLPIHEYDIHAGGIDPNNPPTALKDGAAIPANESFRYAIQPPAREEIGLPDLLASAATCPGGVQRPCAEAITADDPGMMVVNYRNEPLLNRVFDPTKIGPDGHPGAQADGLAGDLAFAMQSRTDRAIPELNTQLGAAPPSYAGDPMGEVFLPGINELSALDPGDPFTPMLRAYAGDTVRVKVQAGGDEEEHVQTINGLKWLQGGSGHGKAGNSGWRNSQTGGISEQFTLAMPVVGAKGQTSLTADYAYSADASSDGWMQGTWGILRNYTLPQSNLFALPDNPQPARIANATDFNRACPRYAPRKFIDVTAVLANEVLPAVPGVSLISSEFLPGDHAGGAIDPYGGTLVYNSRPTVLTGTIGEEEEGEIPVEVTKRGPLHDPTGILYVMTDDLEPTNPACLNVRNPACPVRLKSTVPVEPLVLRAAAGDCMEITLRNRLKDVMPDLPTRNMMQLTVVRDRNLDDPAEGVTWFGNNHVRPSGHAGLHPALVEYDVTRSDGMNVGLNPVQTAAPGGIARYQWFAGHLEPSAPVAGYVTLSHHPIEFGGYNITPADKIKQHQKGMVAAGVVYPEGSSWTVDSGSHTQATVTTSGGDSFRDFTSVWQSNVNLYWADGDAVFNVESEGDGINEDPEDGGHKAVNYGAEPAWFRFGTLPCGDCDGISDAYRYYSNGLVGDVDPETPVFTAAAGDEFRLHLLYPAGGGRKMAPTLHGHVWQRDPYVCPGSSHAGLPGKCATSEVGSRAIGDNPVGFGIGAFQSFMPTGHFEIQSQAGGAGGILGDYLFRDHMGLGNVDGAWGLLRVGEAAAAEPPPPPPPPPPRPRRR